jgi:hypothetical protein
LLTHITRLTLTAKSQRKWTDGRQCNLSFWISRPFRACSHIRSNRECKL